MIAVRQGASQPLRFVAVPLTSLRDQQLRAANPFQIRNIVARQRPHDRPRNALVIVAQHVADPGDLRSGNILMARFEVIRQKPARLGDDLDAAFHKPALAPVSLEREEWHILKLGPNVVDGFDNVVQAR